MVYHFKIQLRNITKPPVWRRVSVPAQYTFEQFHLVIQLSFGWENYHLFTFGNQPYGGSIRISMPDEDDMYGKNQDATKIKLSDIFKEEGDSFFYVYDFGDSWEHTILLGKTTPDYTLHAVCTEGKGACPPEDVGGIWGYQNLKDVLLNRPDSEEAEEYREWLGMEKGETWEEVYPFDKEEANFLLKQI